MQFLWNFPKSCFLSQMAIITYLTSTVQATLQHGKFLVVGTWILTIRSIIRNVIKRICIKGLHPASGTNHAETPQIAQNSKIYYAKVWRIWIIMHIQLTKLSSCDCYSGLEFFLHIWHKNYCH